MPEEKMPLPIPKPRFAPEDENARQAVELGEAVLGFSGLIAQQCQQQPALPDLNRLILERDQALGKLTKLDIRLLPDNVRDWLVHCLRQCQAIDQENLSGLQAIHSAWGTQLQGMKEGSNLMDKYRAGPKEQSTRTEQA